MFFQESEEFIAFEIVKLVESPTDHVGETHSTKKELLLPEAFQHTMILLVIHCIIENRDFSPLDNVQLEARGLSNTLYVVPSGEVSHFDDISELSCEEVPL